MADEKQSLEAAEANEQPQASKEPAPASSEPSSGKTAQTEGEAKADSTSNDDGNKPAAKRDEQWRIHRILIVEDDRVTQKLLSTILSKKGYEVEVADNGRMALKKLQKFEPDLFIIDLNMPVMNGMEVLKQIRKHKKYLMTPVIILTSQRDRVSIVKVANLGIDSYMAKPVKLDLLEQKLMEISRPDGVLRRLLNMRNLLNRQIKHYSEQEKQLHVQIKDKEKQLLEMEKHLQEKINAIHSSKQVCPNAPKLDTLKMQLANKKAEHHQWRMQVHQTLQHLQSELKRLRDDLQSINQLIEQFQGMDIQN